MWEYNKIQFMDGSPDDILKQLNAAGAEGWEMTGTSAIPVTGVNNVTGAQVQGMLFIYWLKRPAKLIQVPSKGVLTHG